MVNLFISRLVINDNIPVVEYSARRLQRNGNIGIFTAEIVKLGLVQPITDIVGEYSNIHISRNIFKENQCGASSKDGGNKVTTITAVTDGAIYHPVIDQLVQNPVLTLR